MKAAHASESSFYTMPRGTQAKVIVRLDEVGVSTVTGTVLERETETMYRLPMTSRKPIVAKLTPETSVVMGEPRQMVRGAVVLLTGTVDADHALHASQVVILTGYVHVLEGVN